MLPNESLLVVLGFADYRTLVIAKLAGTPFLRVVTKFAEELARRRSFRVTFYTEQLVYYDGERRTSILYEAGNETSIVAACRELNAVIGPHFVDHLYFCDNTWNMPGVSVIFEAAPQLKYAEDVEILIDDGVVDEAFMRNFAGLKELRLWLDYDAFSQLSWTFLREESARELRLIEFTQNWRENVRTTLAVEDLVRYCVTLPNRQGGEPLELEFMQTVFSSRNVGRRIIEVSC
ncbi:hypothetical protein AAVH_24056 [Aphelenchoides avenae]|nr:hypothetical protein AAVH_24056 [Aphelenchus avenae]